MQRHSQALPVAAQNLANPELGGGLRNLVPERRNSVSKSLVPTVIPGSANFAKLLYNT